MKLKSIGTGEAPTATGIEAKLAALKLGCSEIVERTLANGSKVHFRILKSAEMEEAELDAYEYAASRDLEPDVRDRLVPGRKWQGIVARALLDPDPKALKAQAPLFRDVDALMKHLGDLSVGTLIVAYQQAVVEADPFSLVGELDEEVRDLVKKNDWTQLRATATQLPPTSLLAMANLLLDSLESRSSSTE